MGAHTVQRQVAQPILLIDVANGTNVLPLHFVVADDKSLDALEQRHDLLESHICGCGPVGWALRLQEAATQKEEVDAISAEAEASKMRLTWRVLDIHVLVPEFLRKVLA